jgi:hypothetical protein
MLPAVAAKVVKPYRCLKGELMANLALTVKYTQRVALKPVAAGLAKLLLSIPEVAL